MNYFDGKVSHGFVSLYTGKTIVMISSGLLGLFLPIFLYNIFGQNLQHTALFYLAGHALYILALFFGVRFLNKFGFRRALRTSVFLGALYYIICYFLDQTNANYLIPTLLLVLTSYRFCYWLPYHVDFAKFTDKKNRGRQISALMATRLTMGIFIPVVAGFVISKFGFDALFVTATILYLVSGVPYLTLPRTEEKFSWTYLQTLKNLFSKKYRAGVTAFVADGAETSAMLVIWPIFMFQLLEGDYLKVGAVSTLIIAITVVLQLTLGKKLDKSASKEKFLKFGSVFYSIGWLIKIFIETAFQIFIAGTFHNLVRIFTRTPFNALSYDMMADQGHYVDEFTVIREIAINTGRIIPYVFAVWLAAFLPIQYLFIVAAVASIGLNLIKPIEREERILI